MINQNAFTIELILDTSAFKNNSGQLIPVVTLNTNYP